MLEGKNRRSRALPAGLCFGGQAALGPGAGAGTGAKRSLADAMVTNARSNTHAVFIVFAVSTT